VERHAIKENSLSNLVENSSTSAEAVVFLNLGISPKVRPWHLTKGLTLASHQRSLLLASHQQFLDLVISPMILSLVSHQVTSSRSDCCPNFLSAEISASLQLSSDTMLIFQNPNPVSVSLIFQSNLNAKLSFSTVSAYVIALCFNIYSQRCFSI
jgi:hypothetical protein